MYEKYYSNINKIVIDQTFEIYALVKCIYAFIVIATVV